MFGGGPIGLSGGFVLEFMLERVVMLARGLTDVQELWQAPYI